jgi:FAD/FMN-containing dehydrogenase
MKGPLSLVGFEPLGGAIARRSKEETAFVGRDANFALGIWAGWTDAEEDEEIIAWTREFYEQVKPYATGGYYSNYLAQDDDAETQQAYGTNIKRLQKVKTKYDPDNFFHQNFNIKPDQI